MNTLGKPPEGVVLTPLSSRVFEVLAEHTAFPWAVLMAQCKRCDVDPTALTPAELKRVATFLSQGVARFTSPEKGAKVLSELESLMGSR